MKGKAGGPASPRPEDDMQKLPRVILVSLATLIPATVLAAYTVKAPLDGKVGDTTYTSSGSFHGAVDISGGICAETGVTTAVMGSLAWNVTIQNTSRECGMDATGGSNNTVSHTFASGRSLRQWHFNKSADSYDRTCDRCFIGTVGSAGLITGGIPRAHLQYDIQGTLITNWYPPYVTKGQTVTTSTTIGSFY
jgi:hypothetical protein